MTARATSDADSCKRVLYGLALVLGLAGVWVGCVDQRSTVDELNYAITRNDYPDVVSLLDKQGSNTARDPIYLVLAADLRDPDILELLLAKGWDPNVPARSRGLDIDSELVPIVENGVVFALATASWGLDGAQAVQILLDAGADKCVKTTVLSPELFSDLEPRTMTPYELAIHGRNVEGASLLQGCT